MKPPVKSIRSALNCLKDPIIIVSDSLECIFANSAFCSFLGCNTEDIEGGAIKDFWVDAESQISRGEEFATEFIAREGEVFLVKLAVHRIDDNGHMVRVIASSSKNDSTINFHAQRLETLGLLAGGIAHDFNNMLTGILGHVSYLKNILPRSGPHTESLSAIEDGARKASSITQEILSFSRSDTYNRAQRVDLTRLISSTYILLRGAISPQYELTSRVLSENLFVIGEEGKISQIIVNLVMNSLDAIEPNGSVEITLDECDNLDELERVFNTRELSSKRYCVLTVSDDGHGIPLSVIDRVFEPYFTTKENRGTGLGLHTVNAIVRSLGGAITINSVSGHGTEVKVYLPLVEGGCLSAHDPDMESPSFRLEGGAEKILIVDDEYPVRNVLSVSLEHLGYTVEVASSGIEAIQKYSEKKDEIDLVILDMLMPQLSGEEVFKRLKAIKPAVNVLIISGFSSQESIDFILSNGGKDFIQKPFTIEDLATKVRTCLSQSV